MIEITFQLGNPVFFCTVEMEKAQHKWVRIALINLAVVALLGVVLRYKIAFPLPAIHQKNLLHAHSHFAFTGWVAQLIMTLIISVVSKRTNQNLFIPFRPLLISNLILSYTLLISFFFQGYGFFSITFSTLSILVAYLFSYRAWRAMHGLQEAPMSYWYFRAAIIFNIISSVGTFWLAWLMVQKNLHQNWYLAAVYFFLHFQYNGWFIFSILGLFSATLEQLGITLRRSQWIFRTLLVTLFPAYLLSTLWAPWPEWIYGIVVLAALLQLAAWVWMFRELILAWPRVRAHIPAVTKWLVIVTCLALTLKFLLQALSTIPTLGQFAFGIRPIVIAYLHLVLLVTVTVFLIANAYYLKAIPQTRRSRLSILVFVLGIIANEVLLMLQGISIISPTNFGITNAMLFVVAVLIFGGAASLVASLRWKELA